MRQCLSHVGLSNSQLYPPLLEMLSESLQLSRISVRFAGCGGHGNPRWISDGSGSGRKRIVNEGIGHPDRRDPWVININILRERWSGMHSSHLRHMCTHLVFHGDDAGGGGRGVVEHREVHWTWMTGGRKMSGNRGMVR